MSELLKVVVTGSECTGKTTLARQLASRFGTPCTAEYARQFVDANGRAPEADDVEVIARGQISLEDAGVAAAGDLLILDTDLVSTVVYSEYYFGACPDWIEALARQRLADQYLLAGTDVPWAADGLQRDRPDAREEIQVQFRRTLRQLGASIWNVEGPREVRLATAVDAVTGLRRRRR